MAATDKAIYELTHQVGKLTGVMEGLIKANDFNSAAMKDNTHTTSILSNFMHETMGAEKEREKSYKRVKHGTVATAFISVGAIIKAFWG